MKEEAHFFHLLKMSFVLIFKNLKNEYFKKAEKKKTKKRDLYIDSSVCVRLWTYTSCTSCT